MSADTRAVAVILHGFEVIDTVLSKSQMTNVINTALSGESAYIADMLQALRLPAVSCMDQSASRLSLPGSRVAMKKPILNRPSSISANTLSSC